MYVLLVSAQGGRQKWRGEGARYRYRHYCAIGVRHGAHMAMDPQMLTTSSSTEYSYLYGACRRPQQSTSDKYIGTAVSGLFFFSFSLVSTRAIVSETPRWPREENRSFRGSQLCDWIYWRHFLHPGGAGQAVSILAESSTLYKCTMAS